MHTLRRPKVRDQAAEQIKQYIVAQSLAPGDRLPTETQLAETFGISRLSVREATKSLEYLGIVEAKTGVGLTVGQIDLQRVTEHLGFHTSLLRAEPRQLIATRIILETGVLPHVAERLANEPGLKSQLQTIIDQSQRLEDLASKIDLDIQFHRSLLELSGLAPIVAFGELLHVFFRRFRESVEQAEWTQAISSHQRIVDHLVAGNILEASAELRRHIASHQERIG